MVEDLTAALYLYESSLVAQLCPATCLQTHTIETEMVARFTRLARMPLALIRLAE